MIGVTGQFSAVDNLLTGEENLILINTPDLDDVFFAFTGSAPKGEQS